jgi:hypothetical protein
MAKRRDWLGAETGRTAAEGKREWTTGRERERERGAGPRGWVVGIGTRGSHRETVDLFGSASPLNGWPNSLLYKRFARRRVNTVKEKKTKLPPSRDHATHKSFVQ